MELELEQYYQSFTDKESGDLYLSYLRENIDKPDLVSLARDKVSAFRDQIDVPFKVVYEAAFNVLKKENENLVLFSPWGKHEEGVELLNMVKGDKTLRRKLSNLFKRAYTQFNTIDQLTADLNTKRKLLSDAMYAAYYKLDRLLNQVCTYPREDYLRIDYLAKRLIQKRHGFYFNFYAVPSLFISNHLLNLFGALARTYYNDNVSFIWDLDSSNLLLKFSDGTEMEKSEFNTTSSTYLIMDTITIMLEQDNINSFTMRSTDLIPNFI